MTTVHIRQGGVVHPPVLTSNLRRHHRRLDMIDQRIGQSQPPGKQIEITALSPRIGLYGKTRGGVDFHLLLLCAGSSHQCVDIQRIGQFLFEEPLGFSVEAGHLHLIHDVGALFFVDMAVCLGSVAWALRAPAAKPATPVNLNDAIETTP